jgi:hypothetical protein
MMKKEAGCKTEMQVAGSWDEVLRQSQENAFEAV